MLHKIKLILAALTLSTLLLMPVSALASTYGSGSYGDCPYGDSCASSSSSSSGSSSSGGSSGASSSTGTTSTSGNQILLNDFDEYFATDGKQIDLKTNQIVYFELSENGKTVKHSVTITSVGKDYIDITIAPDPISDRLYVGGANKYDVNNDSTDDIEITLNSITSGVADMTFRSLSAIPAQSTTKPNKSAPESSLTKSKNYLSLIIFGLLFLLGLGITIYLIIRRRKKKQLFQ